MKRKDKNLEKNISRLVKLTGDSNEPSEAFSKSLTNEALSKLAKSNKARQQDGKHKLTKTKWPRILAYAASILIVCSIVIALTMPRLQKAKPAAWSLARKIAFNGGTVDSEISISGKSVAVLEPAKDSVPQLRDESGAKLAKAKDKRPVSSPRDSYTLSAPKITNVTASEVSSTSSNIRVMGEREGGPIASEWKPLGGSAGRKLAFVGTPKPPKPEPGPGGYPMAHGGTTPPNGEAFDGVFFKNYGVNPFVDTEDDHLSTFATDVDTGSYTIVRRFLHDGHLPPEKAVRVEEFVNYFKYDYPAPQEDVFRVYAEAAPWKFGTGRKNSYLLRLGLKAMQVSEENRKPAVLTFVIDVSGSMNRENRLGLVKKALRMLVERLREEDRIGIAVYGSRGRKVMGHRRLDEKDEILATIESLHAGGSTYAEEGIRIGYEMAESAYRKGYINRVILCSDGVANVGQTGADDILEVIKKKAEKGITLSAIGFGMGNYNDVLMERLGDKGNGHYAYIDTITEAKRIFEDNLTGTLQVVARDVKVQVDFNPAVVRSYRLIGYENRDVPDEKFRDDKYDGGEVGAGHSVTALYELKLWPDKEGTVATTYVRYKDADTRAVTEFKSSIATDGFMPLAEQEINTSFESASTFDFRLATVAAEFAEILRKSYWAKGAKLSDTLHRVQAVLHERPGDADIIELVDLISKANQLMRKADVELSGTEDDTNER